jgi:hypothetical protein
MAVLRPGTTRRLPSRRELIRAGGLGALGLGLPALELGRAAAIAGRPRATSCLIIFLSGGPPQHETFDPKPAAPIEIRGPFLPIATSVPGIQFSELLPRTAARAHQMCVIRSMTTGIHSHSTSGCYMLTGHEPTSVAESVPPSARDWPSIAGAVGALRAAENSPLDSVILPEPIFNNPAIPWPGQNGGFMGAAWHPHLIRCDPSQERLEIEGLSAGPELTEIRLDDRRALLGQVDRQRHRALCSPAMADLDRFQQEAFDLLHAGATRAALEIEREPVTSRDRYGRGKFGQSLLLGRRLIEAGVRLVQVNWPREPGDTTAGNPLWDTHQDNAGRLKDVLCPQFDIAYAALLDDLHDRGLLDETLVVVMGEFGRTPTINAGGGRDHWGSVFSVALAGGGVPGGSVIGASDDRGGQPADRPVRPPDLAATIFQLLGIPPDHEIRDPLDRPLTVVSGGRALGEIVGG